MTEGGISAWKKGEGETFAPGDVLLEMVSWSGRDRRSFLAAASKSQELTDIIRCVWLYLV
jgi:hypothetical protein